MNEVEYYQGETRNLSFQVTLNGAPLNMSACILGLEVRRTLGYGPPYITKADTDFDKSQAAAGVVSVLLTVADLSDVGTHYGQLAIKDSSGRVYKARTFTLIIKPAVVFPVHDLSTDIQVITATSDVVELSVS
jgi:hypothetical protein